MVRYWKHQGDFGVCYWSSGCQELTIFLIIASVWFPEPSGPCPTGRLWAVKNFGVSPSLLRLSLVPGKLDILSLAWMRWCSFHNSSSVVISLMFNFSVTRQVKNTTNSAGWTRGDLWRCQGDYEETGFSYKTEKMSFGDFSMVSLANISVEIPKIYHSGTFCYLLLQDISASLPKAICLL